MVEQKIINVGIVGAGLMGARRSAAIRATGVGRLAAVADADEARAAEFAKTEGCEASKNYEELVQREDIDAVIIAVPNKFLAPIAVLAMEHGKNVFCEKPLGRNLAEAEAIAAAGKKYNRMVKVGFNHRFHSAVMQAKKIFDGGGIGEIMFIRGRYGNGGRSGMEKEWRFNPDISGGGELLDQGSHMVDLCRYFAGEPEEVYGVVEDKFWKPGVDDNAFVLLKQGKITASFHVSATQWKNIFSFEIYGTGGFLNIDGKGGSYGKETLVYGKRKPEFGAPDLEKFEYERDASWEEEWRNFAGALNGENALIGPAEDGVAANRIIEKIYESAKLDKPILI